MLLLSKTMIFSIKPSLCSVEEGYILAGEGREENREERGVGGDKV